MEDKRIQALLDAANALAQKEIQTAEGIINSEYPFVPVKKNGRNYTALQMMEQFYRDGFVDRYSGEKLVNPGILRVMSERMPEAFPYQAHWKTDECHMAYWDYQPTIDHIYPIALGGKDEPTNWATTSMVNNAAKANFTLEQLGWSLKEKGSIQEWDGLSGIFLQLAEQSPELLEVKKIKEWYQATRVVMKKYE